MTLKISKNIYVYVDKDSDILCLKALPDENRGDPAEIDPEHAVSVGSIMSTFLKKKSEGSIGAENSYDDGDVSFFLKGDSIFIRATGFSKEKDIPFSKVSDDDFLKLAHFLIEEGQKIIDAEV